MKLVLEIIVILSSLLFSSVKADQNFLFSDTKKDSSTTKKSEPRITYGNKGWQFQSADGRYLLHVESRLQFRYAYPFDTDPVNHKDFEERDQQIIRINRARIKIGGNVFETWLKYYWEYELAQSNLLDFRVMVEKYPWLKVKVGQWKIHYNRERVISSGKQQMADRSLINRYFTVDRQQGISFYGNLKGNGITDFNYWAGAFMGTGRGNRENDDADLMYLLRGQWNFFGRLLKFTGSDLEFHEKAAGLIALAVVTNKSPYTSFSQSGGGQLPGFDPGAPGQYRVNQTLLETALMYRGFSWQQELHWKEINDRVNDKVTMLRGIYTQFGYFFHYWLIWVPKPLEISLRHALYDPDKDSEDVLMQEFSIDLSWYFNGHRNKLNAELSYFDFQENITDMQDGYRIRFQWDISM
jgi:phosphate-selective porin